MGKIKKNKDYNQTLLKKLQPMSDREVIGIAKQFKMQSIVSSSNKLAKDYNTVLKELKSRKLLK